MDAVGVCSQNQTAVPLNRQSLDHWLFARSKPFHSRNGGVGFQTRLVDFETWKWVELLVKLSFKKHHVDVLWRSLLSFETESSCSVWWKFYHCMSDLFSPKVVFFILRYKRIFHIIVHPWFSNWGLWFSNCGAWFLWESSSPFSGIT